MEDPVELLKELIRINTTNPPGAEAALLDCLERKLAKAQLPFARQETAPGRGNLISRLKADGEITLPPLVLLSHTDVVAADPSQWLHPPFEAWEDENGFIYGRGAVDTKQLTVMELCAYEALAKTPDRCRDVYFLATCDEESGSTYGLQAFLKGSVTLEGETLRGEDILRSSDGRFLTGLGARVYGYSPVYLWDMTFDTAVTMVHGVNERIHKDSVRLGTDVLSRAAVYAVKEEIKND